MAQNIIDFAFFSKYMKIKFAKKLIKYSSTWLKSRKSQKLKLQNGILNAFLKILCHKNFGYTIL